MLYQWHELQRALLAPLTAWAQAASNSFANPASPLAYVPGLPAGCPPATNCSTGSARTTRNPNSNLHQIVKEWSQHPDRRTDSHREAVLPPAALQALRRRQHAVTSMKDEPVVLVCAPLSGHHATLLRDTVKTLLQDHKVYITDWIDARMVPSEDGTPPLRRSAW